jgi:hypothetical protein
MHSTSADGPAVTRMPKREGETPKGLPGPLVIEMIWTGVL